jgi:hypothetical protein
MPTPLEISLETSARRERVWHAACLAGRCRYNTGVEQENPASVDVTNTCGGYHGTKYTDLETGQVSWRWRPCGRHLAWWEKRKEYVRMTRPGTRHAGRAE